MAKWADISERLRCWKWLAVAAYEGLHGAFVKALKVLPAGVVFHQQDCYFRDRYRGKGSNGADFLDVEKIPDFTGNWNSVRHCFLRIFEIY